MPRRICGSSAPHRRSFVAAAQDAFGNVLSSLYRASLPPEDCMPSRTFNCAQRWRPAALPEPHGYCFTKRVVLVSETTPTGRLIRRTGMSIDSDGAPNVTRAQDPHHQSQTSMHWGGRYVDASAIPYVVLPLGRLPRGVRLGDLVRVSYNGRTVYAIIADRGGHDTSRSLHGEGSMRLAAMLGIDADPRHGGVDAGVTYEIIPGSGARFGIRNGGPTFTEEQIQAFGATAFEQGVFSFLA